MKNAINVSDFDRLVYDKTAERSPQLRNLQQEKEGSAYHDLLTDAFGAFYKYYPQVQEENDIDADRKINQKIMTELTALKEFEQLRVFTKGDPENSVGALDKVKQIWSHLPSEVTDAQNKVEQISEQLDEALNGEGDEQAIKDAFSQLKKAEEKLEFQLQEYEDEIRGAVRSGIAAAEQSAADAEEGAAILGWGKDGTTLQPASADDKLKIAQALKSNQKLQDIMKMAGRMRNIAQKKQRQKINYFRTEITGIEQGDDLTAVVPSEFAYFVSKRKCLHTLFLKRLQNSELIQYEMDSKEPKAQGPVVLLIDCSGSMNGQPDRWSKAMALTMYGIARLQKRDFAILLFNSHVAMELIIPKGEHKSEKLISVLTAGVGGGTSFESPLSRGLEIISTSQFNKADMIMITDGYCDISPDFQKKFDQIKMEKQFQMISILIGGGSYAETICKKFSNTTLSLDKMIGQNEGGAFDVCFGI